MSLISYMTNYNRINHFCKVVIIFIFSILKNYTGISKYLMQEKQKTAFRKKQKEDIDNKEK